MIKILDSLFQRLGVIKNAISCSRLEEINGENVLDFTAILDAKLNNLIDENTIFELNNEYFDVAFLKKSANEDNTFTAEVEAESISYRLNKEEYNVEWFTELGTPSYILGKVLEGTGFTVGTVEFSEQTAYSAQEAKSRRQLLMEVVAYLGGEVLFNNFSISILIRRGSTDTKLAIKDRNVKVASKTLNKRSLDEHGDPLVSYECTPIHLPGDEYALGDNIRLMQKDLGINEELRVVSVSTNPYDERDAKFIFSNYTDGLASQLYRIEVSTVIKDRIYNGCRIGPEFGFENVRSDKMARSYFRADELKFQSGDGTGENWIDQLYFWLDEENFEMMLIFSGLLHGGRISIGGTFIDPMFKVDKDGNVFARSVTLSEYLRIIGKNNSIMIDEWGIDPDFMKLFPNKILNSGFEWNKLDKYGKLKPMYWIGDGVSTDWSNWEGTYALQLKPGQKMEQGTIDGHTLAGADPVWWDNMQTRVSFRHKGGRVRVRVKIYPHDEGGEL